MVRAVSKSGFAAWQGMLLAVMIVVVASATVNVVAQEKGGAGKEAKTADVWEPYRFLMGDWIGEETGRPGAGSGGFSFATDLDDNILVRKSFAHFPAEQGKAEFTHSDFMVVYPESDKPIRAIYWDNEAHVINYTVDHSPAADTVTFLSDPVKGQPRFRLSYIKLAQDTVNVVFEYSTPDRQDTFRTYLTGRAFRKK
jgi:hypothetical protein